jgi:hypothetical protein
MLGVNAACVSVELGCAVDAAGDGTVSIEFSLHLICTFDMVILRDVVLGVFDSPAAIKAGFIRPGWGPCAVTADVNVFAHVALEVECGVLHARRVVQTAVVSILIDCSGVASVARASFLAVYNNLSIKSDWGRDFEVSEDVESVSDGRSGALSPAGSAILGDMLVLAP